MSQLNIIVTGGFGELGSAVSQVLAQQGHKVCRVDFAADPSEKSHSTLDLAKIDLTLVVANYFTIGGVSRPFS